MRRLLPSLLKDNLTSWKAVNWACTVITATTVGTWLGSPWFSALVMGLPVFRQSFQFPVLTDPVGLMFLSFAAYTQNPLYAVLGGFFNEKAPIFGSLLLWSPVSLLGLIPAIVLSLAGEKPKEDDPEWLRKPFKAAFNVSGRLGEPKCAVWPWGGLLMAFPQLGFKEWCAVGVGYLTLLTGQDSARLYQWCSLSVLSCLPTQWAPLAALLCWVNPERERL